VRNCILHADSIRHADPAGKAPVEILIGAVVILTAPIFQRLAISLPLGLLSSTLLTVLVIPAIYRVLKT
jgi:multidrug efflux pump subunit AcrB